MKAIGSSSCSLLEKKHIIKQMVCEHMRNKEVITRSTHDFLKASHDK